MSRITPPKRYNSYPPSIATVCVRTYLQLLKTLQESHHGGVKLGVPDELEAAGAVQGQLAPVRQYLSERAERGLQHGRVMMSQRHQGGMVTYSGVAVEVRGRGRAQIREILQKDFYSK